MIDPSENSSKTRPLLPVPSHLTLRQPRYICVAHFPDTANSRLDRVNRLLCMRNDLLEDKGFFLQACTRCANCIYLDNDQNDTPHRPSLSRTASSHAALHPDENIEVKANIVSMDHSHQLQRQNVTKLKAITDKLTDIRYISWYK